MRSPRYHRGDSKPAPGPRCPGSPAEAFPMISEGHEAPRKETMSCRALSESHEDAGLGKTWSSYRIH